MKELRDLVDVVNALEGVEMELGQALALANAKKAAQSRLEVQAKCKHGGGGSMCGIPTKGYGSPYCPDCGESLKEVPR